MAKLVNKLIVSAVALMIGLMPLSTKTLAAEGSYTNEVVIKQTKYLNNTVNKAYTVGNYTEFYNAIKSSINNVDQSIKIVLSGSYLKGGVQEFTSAFKEISEKISPGEYVTGYEYSYNPSNTSEYKITYYYDRSIDEIKRQKSEVSKKINEVMPKIVSSSMTNSNKLKAIHDYVVNNTSYDTQNYNSGNIPRESHTSYGALINKTAVCDGYASTMNKMLDYVGIENMIVTGTADGVAHAWNLVKVDGVWSHVDATWDDPVYIVNGQVIPKLTYDYYCKTDTYMAKDHTWNRNNYPKADAVKYKNGKRNLPSKYFVNAN